jgi:multiple sugar transport system permease protein
MATEAATSTAAQAELAGRHMSRRTRRAIAFYAFISPWLIGFLLLTAVPMFVGFLTSLTNYDGLNINNLKFLGLDNYARILDDSNAMYAMGRTLLWTALNVPIWLIASFTLALILDRSIRAVGIFRTIFYLPSIIPIVSVVWVWRAVLNQNGGLLNGFLSLFRENTAIIWTSGDLAIYSATVISVWAGLGGGMIIFLAGLQNIPSELKEAAYIDGAGEGRVIRHVIMPLMTPVIFFQLILSIISAIQQFVLPMILASIQGFSGQLGAVPPRSIYLYMVHVNLQIFTRQRFGYGMSLLWVLFIVIVIFTIIVFWTSRYWVYYETDQRKSS